MSKEINDLYEHVDKINTRFSNFWLRYIEAENEIEKISKILNNVSIAISETENNTDNKHRKPWKEKR